MTTAPAARARRIADRLPGQYGAPTVGYFEMADGVDAASVSAIGQETAA